MPIFVVRYDYGKGATHLGIVAESVEEIHERLQWVTVVNPEAEGLTPSLVQRLEQMARSIDDPLWDEMRRTKQ